MGWRQHSIRQQGKHLDLTARSDMLVEWPYQALLLHSHIGGIRPLSEHRWIICWKCLFLGIQRRLTDYSRRPAEWKWDCDSEYGYGTYYRGDRSSISK